MAEAVALRQEGPHRTSQAMPPAVRDAAEGLRTLAEHGVVIHENVISAEFADRLRDRMDEQAYMERKLGLGNVSGETGASGKPTIGSICSRQRRFSDGLTAVPLRSNLRKSSGSAPPWFPTSSLAANGAWQGL